MGELRGERQRFVHAWNSVPKGKRTWGAFPLSSPSQVWFEEQAERSARGMLCKDHRESEDTALILTPSPSPEKSVLTARRSNQNVTQGSVIWVGQSPPSQLGSLWRRQAAMLLPRACGPLGVSLPPRGKDTRVRSPTGHQVSILG